LFITEEMKAFGDSCTQDEFVFLVCRNQFIGPEGHNWRIENV